VAQCSFFTFNQLAADHDVAGMDCFGCFGRRQVEQAGIKPGHARLDVATGRGAILIPAAERLGPQGSIVGVGWCDDWPCS